jgi:Fe-S-cluster containining protein
VEGILADYRALLAEADVWFGRCQEQAPAQIACRTGCSGCCRGLFDITLLDGLLLRAGLVVLQEAERAEVEEKSAAVLARLQQRWPGFGHPFLLNHLPQEEWTELPAEDETPCVLLGADGRCRLYAHRPLICRLHGLPHVDRSGEVFAEEWCTRNFPGAEPMRMPELRWEFRALFTREAALLRRLAARLGRPGGELDTFIPTALLLDPARLA